MIDFSDLAASRGVAVAEAVGRLALNSGSALRPFRRNSVRWAAVAAFIAISGCSTGGTQQPAKDAAAKQAAADTAAAAKKSGEAAATETADAAVSSSTGGPGRS